MVVVLAGMVGVVVKGVGEVAVDQTAAVVGLRVAVDQTAAVVGLRVVTAGVVGAKLQDTKVCQGSNSTFHSQSFHDNKLGSSFLALFLHLRVLPTPSIFLVARAASSLLMFWLANLQMQSTVC